LSAEILSDEAIPKSVSIPHGWSRTMKRSARFVFAAGGFASLICALLFSAGRSVAQSEGEGMCDGSGKLCTRTTVVTCYPNGCASSTTYTYYNF
jgi:hypothetical protein